MNNFFFPTDRAWLNFWLMIFSFFSLILLKDLLKLEAVLILSFMTFYFLNEWLKDVEEYKEKEVNKNG